MTFRLFAPVILVILVIVIGSSGSSAASHEEPGWVAFSIGDSGAVIVPVSVNGHGPFPFLLDTGSSHSVMSGSLAARLELEYVAKTSVLTSTGREWRPVVKLDQTRIGSARSEGLLASVAPSTQLAAIARDIEGIIGQDFLFELNYTLDYRRKRLSWTDGKALTTATRLALVSREGRYLVEIAGQPGKPPVRLVPDSGASGFVMYERNGRTRLTLDPVPQVMSVHSLSGGQDVRTMMLRELTLGGVTIRNQPVAVVKRDSDDVLEGDGLFPLHLFSTITFNAEHKYITLSQ